MRDAAPMLRPREVADRLACDLDTVYSLISSGELCAHNIAPRTSRKASWRIAEADLQAFLASRTYQRPVPRQRRRRRDVATGYQRY